MGQQIDTRRRERDSERRGIWRCHSSWNL